MRSDRIYITHIIKSIETILFYVDSISESEFYNNQLVSDAVIRNFEVLGEAAKRVSQVSREKYPKLPWRQMAGMRDRLIHNYEGVNLQQVWDTIVDVLPTLRKDLEEILKED